MKILAKPRWCAALGAGLALSVVALSSMTPPLTPPAQSTGAVVSLCDGPTTCFEFDTIAQGQNSGFGFFCLPSPAPEGGGVDGQCYANLARPEFEAILRNECTWSDLWEKHTSNQFPRPPLPPVNFDTHVVVAVISGERPDNCFEIEITRITRGPCDSRRIHVRERVPCPDDICGDVVTNNFHFIRVCRELLPFTAQVGFDHESPDPPCSVAVSCSDG